MTIYHTDTIEKSTIEPIAELAKKDNYTISFSTDFTKPSEIGIYCSHQHFPIRSKLSIIGLHDLGQSHDHWPKFWDFESWHRFDLGFLPGKFWESMYLQHSTNNKFVSPKQGLFTVGWPKSDFVFSNTFKEKMNAFKKLFNFKYDNTILYAPSWENDNKQQEFVESLKDIKCNLLIKQADWSDKYPHIQKNIQEMEDYYKNKYEHVYTMDKKESIFHAIGLSDLLVSDESGVMLEALILNVPSIACIDWKIPDTSPPRNACVPFDHIKKIKKQSLKDEVLKQLSIPKNKNQEISSHWFSNQGNAAQVCLDIINKVNENKLSDLDKTNLSLPQPASFFPIKQQFHFWKHKIRIS